MLSHYKKKNATFFFLLKAMIALFLFYFLITDGVCFLFSAYACHYEMRGLLNLHHYKQLKKKKKKKRERQNLAIIYIYISFLSFFFFAC